MTVKKQKQPTLIEVVNRFDSEEKCIAYLERLRFPKGLECSKCGSKRVFKFDAKGKTEKIRHLYECVDCRYQCSITAGTIFHDSHLPLVKWFLAIYMICSAKKGVPATQLKRELGITYKTAWYMAHRIRLAMQDDSDFCRKFSGVVEVDETYIGGKRKGRRGRGSPNKVPVVGIKNRTSGEVRMKAVKNVSSSTLKSMIRGNVAPGAEVHTDEFKSYLWLDSSEYVHSAVNHQQCYVDGDVHVNGCENVWSLFKRSIVGIYHKVSAKYLPLYLDECSFRFNHRGAHDLMDRVLQTSF